MCGIAGLLEPPNPRQRGLLGPLAESMATSLRHRGPDDDGLWCDPGAGVALAHRRLEVVAPGAPGRQPMTSPSGRWVLNYNGELYNADDLLASLTTHTALAAGGSDTAVLALALDRWGLDRTVDQMEGMYAFAAWDTVGRRLHLVRDRFGEKPLYYGWVGGRFAFASELKPFHLLPGFGGDLEPAALDDYLRWGCVPAPRCIYRRLAKLAPGCHVWVDHSSRPGVLPPQVAYWTARQAVQEARGLPLLPDGQETLDLLEEKLASAVVRRMTADAPVGALLSGGVDSTLVVALMQQNAAGPIHTFTAAFDDATYDESEAAARTAGYLGTEHHTVPTGAPDIVAAAEAIPEIWDEPFADSAQLPSTLVAAAARGFVTVALSGDGADELFGGYNRHLWLDRVWRLRRSIPPSARRGVGDAMTALAGGPVDAVASALPRRLQVRLPAVAVEKMSRVLQSDCLESAYSALTSPGPDPSGVLLKPCRYRGYGGGYHLETVGHWPVTDRLLLSDLTHYLPNDVLTRVDRAAMSVALEPRAPFLDRSLLQVAWRLPPGFRTRRGTNKWALRQVLHRHVPADLVDRPKMSYGPPVGSWLRGFLRPWGEELLSSAALARHGVLAPEPVRRIWAEHQSGRRDLGSQIWVLAVLQSWLERWS